MWLKNPNEIRSEIGICFGNQKVAECNNNNNNNNNTQRGLK